MRTKQLSALLLTILLSGCGFELPFTNQAGPEASVADGLPSSEGAADGQNIAAADGAPAGAVQPTAANPDVQNQLVAAKIGPYATRCLNRLSARAFSAEERYLSWANGESGPTGQERTIYGLYTLSSTAPCREAVSSVADQAPSMPRVESAASEYVSAVEVLAPLLEEANRYYERQSYRDDGMAEGRRLHPQLMAAFAGFREADEKLRTEVDARQDEVRAYRLTRLAQDPRARRRYLIERTLDHALVFSRLSQRLAVEGGTYVAQDSAGLVSKAEALQTSVDELSAWRPEAGGEPIDSAFVDAAERVLESALSLMRRVRDRTPFTGGDRMFLGGPGGWMVDGSQRQLEQRYNRLVSAYNGLQ